jgi:hypothetical protein
LVLERLENEPETDTPNFCRRNSVLRCQTIVKKRKKSEYHKLRTNPRLSKAQESVDIFRAANEGMPGGLSSKPVSILSSRPVSICETKLTTVIEEEAELMKSKVTYGKGKSKKNSQTPMGTKDLSKVF